MRIVSLCPSLTELVFDLGLGDDLVGITDYCVHPADRVTKIEKVGGTKTPDVPRILELAPDIVLLNEEENRRDDADELEEAGVSCHVSFPRTTADTAEMVRSIARALEREAEGEAIARDIEERSGRVRRDAAGATPVSYAYLIWMKPIMAVNDDTFVHALLSMAGGVNVFGKSETRYPEVTAAELARANPDAVLLSTEPFAFEAKHIAELAEATGLPRERFHIVDGEYLSWHGSRTPDGVDYAERVVARIRERLE